jgi:xylulokinase
MNVVVGIDLGTQGARAVAATRAGALLASAREILPPAQPQPPGRHEQDAETWWAAICGCLRRLTAALPRGTSIDGLAITSTSGTIVPLGARGQPLHAALMYNDARSSPHVPEVRQAAADLEARLGYAFDASFGLPKMLWFAREQPAIFARIVRFAHAADFVAGRLSGEYATSDWSNALKSGYDLIEGRWPEFIESALGIPLDRLPRVVAPGAPIARVSAGGASASGLPAGTPLFAGATDGTAGQLASGAVEPGSWNSSLGTTLIVKGISAALLHDPQRRVYCHRHPEGWWMPGGASNTGAEWIARECADDDVGALDRLAAPLLPTGIVRYPLARRGERFPFRHAHAEGFSTGEPRDRIEWFAAGLEGLALVERLAYDILAGLGAAIYSPIYATGGAARSDIWLRVRASALGRSLARPAIGEAAMGAALLAAAPAWFGDLGAAARAMVHIERLVEPDARLQDTYAAKYRTLIAELRQRGYLQDHDKESYHGHDRQLYQL